MIRIDNLHKRFGEVRAVDGVSFSADDGQVTGLLALMLLNDARRLARTGSAGEIIPLAEQDRSLWNSDYITEGVALAVAAFGTTPLGEYQIQAAIAALHDEADRAEDTDWQQILALYGLLEDLSGNPMVKLNRAIAAAMVHGPDAGLELLEPCLLYTSDAADE